MRLRGQQLLSSIPLRGMVVILLVVFITGLAYLALSGKKPSGVGHGEHGHGESGGHDEDKINLSETAIELGGIVTDRAISRPVISSVNINGRIIPNQDHFAHINPRFPGVVRAVNVNLGDMVKTGQTLAIIEANGSLSRYPVVSKMAGVVVKKDVVHGEFVADSKVIFSIANLESVWVDLSVPETDFSKITAGQKVIVQSWESNKTIESTINYVSPIIYKDSQTVLARTIIQNEDLSWRPGLFVTAKVITDNDPVEVAVNRDAIQILEGKKVVFVREDDELFEVRPVKLGRVGSKFVEILSGLSVGENYVSENSYILKADFLKSQAEHVH
ncbi:MAG: efflux RND transporter periplasmic adaptor subunit [Bdellovibrionota bacterium]